jgi:hypothetical protein
MAIFAGLGLITCRVGIDSVNTAQNALFNASSSMRHSRPETSTKKVPTGLASSSIDTVAITPGPNQDCCGQHENLCRGGHRNSYQLPRELGEFVQMPNDDKIRPRYDLNVSSPLCGEFFRAPSW